jgi:adenosylcobinamide-phosphate synthase
MAAVAALMICGVALDLLLGEARRWHPLVGFGNLATLLEKRLNRPGLGFARGVVAWTFAVLPLVALSACLLNVGAGTGMAVAAAAVVHVLLLYFALGLRSLRDHNLPIATALLRGDLAQARALTARIVSRDTASEDSAGLAKASTESLLENGNDAVFGTLFWFAVAGGPGALLFRLANTLDAMWGYKNTRLLQFGWAAARIDDVLNFIPARLTALSYVLLAGDARTAWRCWRSQAPAWPSPNAGPVMASGAGALGIALGGSARYDGIDEQRPPLGAGSAPQASDIARAWRLVWHTTALWLAATCLLAATATIWSVLHA